MGDWIHTNLQNRRPAFDPIEIPKQFLMAPLAWPSQYPLPVSATQLQHRTVAAGRQIASKGNTSKGSLRWRYKGSSNARASFPGVILKHLSYRKGVFIKEKTTTLRGAQQILLAKRQSVSTVKRAPGEMGGWIPALRSSEALFLSGSRQPLQNEVIRAADSKTGTPMERLTEKVSKVVNSCVTPQQLEVAENFAERAKTKMNPDEWLDIASVINNRANKILFCSAEDLAILGKVWSRL